MSTEILNITRQVVSQKVEEILKHSHSPYKSAFADPQLRQKLVVRVLNNASPCYVFQEGNGNGNCALNGSPISSDEEKCIEAIIHETVNEMLQEEDSSQYFQTYRRSSWPQEPSHWFG